LFQKQKILKCNNKILHFNKISCFVVVIVIIIIVVDVVIIIIIIIIIIVIIIIIIPLLFTKLGQ
jgi:hypothetical protein